jgi:glutamate-5-semialdehyde dehydrogenase
MNYLDYFEKAKNATGNIISLSPELVNQVLHDLSGMLLLSVADLLIANRLDLEQMPASDPKFDRLRLTPERILDMAKDVANVADLVSPLGEVLSRQEMPNGMEISRVSVPLGVVGVIYEARPNVTVDVFALCFKTGNVCILKGGADAVYSNKAIINIIHDVLRKHSIDENVVVLLPPEREAADALLGAAGYIDVLIPRGSQQLINHVRMHSRVPVIETGAGIVHIFFDETADLINGSEIIHNAKTRRVSVCNALDCLIIHQNRLEDLPFIAQKLAAKHVELFADEPAYQSLSGMYPSTLLHHAHPEHFGTEFLSLKMAVKTVGNLEAAIAHIRIHSSKHSEAILSEDQDHIITFLNQVDAAAVYANASTAFTDGAQFGLGAEIGISTQKLHARGPMGLKELTSYKWVINGKGQIRS